VTPGDWVSLAVHLAAGGTLAVIARDLLKVNERVERCEQHAEQDDRRDRHLASECAQLRDELDRAQKKLAVLWLERKAQELTPNGWGDDELETRARPSSPPSEPPRSPNEPALPSFTRETNMRWVPGVGIFADWQKIR